MSTQNKEVTIYNKKKLFEEKILPLAKEIEKQCAIIDIPFFATFAPVNGEKETKYVNCGRLPGSAQINLKEDHFTKHLMVTNGFDIKPKGIDDAFTDAVGEAFLSLDNETFIDDEANSHNEEFFESEEFINRK